MENKEVKFRNALALIVNELDASGSIGKQYNWIALDKSGDLYAFDYRPSRQASEWDNFRADALLLGNFNNLNVTDEWERSRFRIEDISRTVKYDFSKIAFDLNLPILFDVMKNIPSHLKWIANDSNNNIYGFEHYPFVSGNSFLAPRGNAHIVGFSKYFSGSWNLSILKVEDVINALKQRGYSMPPRNYEAPLKVVPKPAPVPKPKNDAAELIEAQIRDRRNKIENLQNEIKSLTDAARILRGR